VHEFGLFLHFFIPCHEIMYENIFFILSYATVSFMKKSEKDAPKGVNQKSIIFFFKKTEIRVPKGVKQMKNGKKDRF